MFSSKIRIQIFPRTQWYQIVGIRLIPRVRNSKSDKLSLDLEINLIRRIPIPTFQASLVRWTKQHLRPKEHLSTVIVLLRTVKVWASLQIAALTILRRVSDKTRPTIPWSSKSEKSHSKKYRKKMTKATGCPLISLGKLTSCHRLSNLELGREPSLFNRFSRLKSSTEKRKSLTNVMSSLRPWTWKKRNSSRSMQMRKWGLTTWWCFRRMGRKISLIRTRTMMLILMRRFTTRVFRCALKTCFMWNKCSRCRTSKYASAVAPSEFGPASSKVLSP